MATSVDTRVRLGDLESMVATFFGLHPADLHSSRKSRTVSLARSLAMFLARRHTRMSFPEIGRFMGKNHSSAVLAVQRIEALIETNGPCRWLTPAGPKSMPAKALLSLLAEQLP
jgi:chromosomal replication initiator protein